MFGAESLDDGVVYAASRGSAADVNRIAATLAQQVRSMTIIRLTPSPGQWHAVDGLVQQALAAVLQGLPTLRQASVAGLRSFVSSIVSHKVADFLRASSGAPQRSLDSVQADASASVDLKDLLLASG